MTGYVTPRGAMSPTAFASALLSTPDESESLTQLTESSPSPSPPDIAVFTTATETTSPEAGSYADLGGPPPRTSSDSTSVTLSVTDEYAMASSQSYVAPSGPPQPYQYDGVIGHDEDRFHEFKAIQNAKSPTRRISDYVGKYVNAFLNTSGGTIYFGVTDDGVIKGVWLSRSDRDTLRLALDSMMHAFFPPVDPALIQLYFVPVVEAPRYPTFVVEIHVSPGPAAVYLMAKGKATAYIRRHSSTYVMPIHLIIERMSPSSSSSSSSSSSTATASSTANTMLGATTFKINTPTSTPIPGRESQLNDLASTLLSKTSPIKVVAIAGPPGIGKGVFARRLVALLSPTYPRQLAVSLKPTPSSSRTIGEVYALVIRAFYPHMSPLPASQAELRGLFVSCFQEAPALLLLEDVPPGLHIPDLLPSSPSCVLLTSSSPLTIPPEVGEIPVRLTPLSLDDSSAYLLSVHPSLTSQQASDVAALTGGFPLALTVIAALLRKRTHLPLEPLLERLSTMDIFTLDGSSLGAALVELFSGLTQEQQLRFIGLATFPGPFDVEAAAYVLDLDIFACEEFLTEFHDHFLIQYSDETNMYSLHTLVRKFVLHQTRALDLALSSSSSSSSTSTPVPPEPSTKSPSTLRPSVVVPTPPPSLTPSGSWPYSVSSGFLARFVEYFTCYVEAAVQIKPFGQALSQFAAQEANIMHALEQSASICTDHPDPQTTGRRERRSSFSASTSDALTVVLVSDDAPATALEEEGEMRVAYSKPLVEALCVVDSVPAPEALMTRCLVSGGPILRARYPPATSISLLQNLLTVLLAVDPEAMRTPMASMGRMYSPSMRESDAKDATLAAVHHELGIAYVADAQVMAGVAEFKAALSLRRNLGQRIPDLKESVADTLIQMGEALLASYQFDSAKRALDEAYGLVTPTSLQGVTALHGLASADREMADLVSADKRLRLGLATLDNMEDTADAWEVRRVRAEYLELIGQVREGQGRYGQARRALIRALGIYRALGKEGEAAEASARTLLANVYGAESKYEQSEAELEKALSLRRALFGPTHHLVANSLRHLAFLTFYCMDDYAKAEALYDQARDMVADSVGSVHAEYAAILNDLALLASHQQEYDKALDLFRVSLDVRLQLFEDDHPLLASTYNNMGNVYRRLKDYPKAHQYLTDALAIRTSRLGHKHPEVARTLHNLGMLAMYMQDLDQSYQYIWKAAEMRKALLGEEHPEVASSYSALGTYFMHLDQPDQAESYIRQALTINRASLGGTHRNVLFNLRSLVQCLTRQQKYAAAEPFIQDSVRVSVAKYGVDDSRAKPLLKAMVKFYTAWFKSRANSVPDESSSARAAFSASRLKSALSVLHSVGANSYAVRMEDELERLESQLEDGDHNDGVSLTKSSISTTTTTTPTTTATTVVASGSGSWLEWAVWGTGALALVAGVTAALVVYRNRRQRNVSRT